MNKNRRAAQAAGIDPSRYNSTNRQNPLIQQDRFKSRTSYAIWMLFKILNILQFLNILFFAMSMIQRIGHDHQAPFWLVVV